MILFLYRKKQVDFAEHRALEDNLILSPVSGVFEEIYEKNNSKRIVIRMYPWDSYGIYMPFYGQVNNFYHKSTQRTFGNSKTVLEIGSNLVKKVKLKIKTNFFNKPIFHIASGDRASRGAFLGYFPLGGKILVEVPVECDILIKKGDKVLSQQTILASI